MTRKDSRMKNLAVALFHTELRSAKRKLSLVKNAVSDGMEEPDKTTMMRLEYNVKVAEENLRQVKSIKEPKIVYASVVEII